jgi:hypothetical protein
MKVAIRHLTCVERQVSEIYGGGTLGSWAALR